ncbi:MAG: phosphoribosylanthranilate isomerase [Elusimicrobia bacterium]|nr:phosphoribosylanthranilate isomerase [Elusimicrobiota bacterium]
MNGIKIKICGITNERDVKFISMLDVNFLGFNLVKGTKRSISEKRLMELARIVPPYITSVAVMIEPEIKDIKRIIKKTGINHFQFHGSESPEFLKGAKELGIKIIKAFRPAEESDIGAAGGFVDVCDYFLIDSYSEKLPGGTGVPANFDFARKLKEFGKPLFLSGGLNPENVSKAVEEVRPFAVDVASGVEKSPRSKDIEKVREFVRAARSV